MQDRRALSMCDFASLRNSTREREGVKLGNALVPSSLRCATLSEYRVRSMKKAIRTSQSNSSLQSTTLFTTVNTTHRTRQKALYVTVPLDHAGHVCAREYMEVSSNENSEVEQKSANSQEVQSPNAAKALELNDNTVIGVRHVDYRHISTY
ncbi:hypothetical protein Tco_1006207 [Tanacetum coccineum]|uniref:Uncharacterized protein n=1 Tax=Tanacetum coccineum TaxID=301880 RepID=A0ABQ5FI64_9ASTR